MKIFYFLILVLVVVSCNPQGEIKEVIVIDLESKMVAPSHYIVTKVNDTIVVDGIANESGWLTAEYSEPFIDIEGELIPKYDTKIKMLWDEDYFYVFAEMEEPHIWGDLKQRDTIIYYNNDFEVFISPSGTTRNYGEVEINALGTVWDLLLDKPYRDYGKANDHWNLDDLKSEVQVVGTLNESSDIDSIWTVEMAIPLEALIELKAGKPNLPVEGEQWRINFSRVEWDHELVNGQYQRKKDSAGDFLPEYNWVWSNQNVINMHEPEKWGIVQFTYESTSKEVNFIEDIQLKTKQVAFALFRETKYGELSYMLDEKGGFTQNIVVAIGQNENYEATFYKTNFGFEYKIICPNSGSQFIINEAGSLKITE